uniref:Uncharacterized protein n=1 Tax=Dichotomaria marginata TaxID=268567 RepID=A0A1G4NS75_9FLOR|nr:Hypothetical protein ORF_3 [Dichotomaria marginata]SCW21532.1 Hypothetical protein ORF_3 [Dichotomaria marginata]
MEIIIQDIDYITCGKYITQHMRYNLFYLQKKIYQAAKECHISLVHSLQKLLVSLFSTRLLAEQISNKAYFLINNQDVQILNKNKLLIFWSLEAEWMYKIRNTEKSKYKYYDIWSCIWYQNKIPNIQIDYKYLINKLQSIHWINNNLILLFRDNHFIQQSKHHFNTQIFYVKHQDLIFNLLSNIIILGLDWIYFRQEFKNIIYEFKFYNALIKDIYFFTSYSTSSLTNKLINRFLYNIGFFYYSINNFRNLKCYKNKDHIQDFTNYYLQLVDRQLFNYNRYLLFHKDKRGRLRVNSNINIKNINIQFFQTLKKCYNYCQIFIDNHAFNQIDFPVNLIRYKWIKKYSYN